MPSYYSVGVWGDLLAKHVLCNASNKALEMKLDVENLIGVQLGFNCIDLYMNLYT
jgi:hypothetical protein